MVLSGLAAAQLFGVLPVWGVAAVALASVTTVLLLSSPRPIRRGRRSTNRRTFAERDRRSDVNTAVAIAVGLSLLGGFVYAYETLGTEDFSRVSRLLAFLGFVGMAINIACSARVISREHVANSADSGF